LRLLSPEGLFRKGVPGSMERILVIKLYAIGDLVMSLPGMSFLGKANPSAEIHLLTGKLVAPLAELAAPVERVFSLDDSLLSRGWKSLKMIPRALELRGNRYSTGYLLHRVLPLRMFLRLVNPVVAVGQGTASAGLDRVVPFETGKREHDAERYARLFGWKGETPLELPPFPVEKLRKAAGEGGMVEGMPVAICPGGGRSTIRNTDAKRWPPKNFLEIARRLHSAGFPTVLLGSGGDAAFLGELRRELEGETIDLVGETTLLQAAAVLSRCRLLVTNDSGLMHVAGLVGTPTLAVFGPTDPDRIGVFPGSARHVSIVPRGFDCRPCHPPMAVDECPDPRCIGSVDVERVWSGLVEMLDG